MIFLIGKLLTWLVLGLISRHEVIGLENVPRTGKFLLMANHVSWLDPPILGWLIPRRITFMAKEELFRNWFVRWVVANYGAFPIRRGEGDRQALREALKVLDSGGVLGMFPEGTRSRDGQLQAGQPGIALLALRSGAPVLPVAIVGTDRIWRLSSLIRRPRFTVTIGRPFKLSESEAASRRGLSDLSDVMMLHLAEILPVELRGAYRDRVAGQVVRK